MQRTLANLFGADDAYAPLAMSSKPRQARRWVSLADLARPGEEIM